MWQICVVGELRCGRVAEWKRCSMGELCCGDVAVWECCSVWHFWCADVTVFFHVKINPGHILSPSHIKFLTATQVKIEITQLLYPAQKIKKAFAF